MQRGESGRHPRIPLPPRIYGERRNSAGLEFGHRRSLKSLTEGMGAVKLAVEAVPLFPGAGRDGEASPVMSPADEGRQVGTVVFAAEGDVGPAVEAAREGFRRWSRLPAGERAAALERTGDLIEANRDRLMALLSHEAGKTLDDGLAEMREAVDFCRYYAQQARAQFADFRMMPGPTGEDNRYGWRGRGVFACISPWNFPLAIFTGQVTAALVAGNAVIAKPAEQTPLIAYEAVRLMHEAGVPKDVLIYLPGAGDVGAALTAHPAIAGVAFTGSTETARAINRTLAAKDGPIVPLIAETGGLNAMVVDATALSEQVTDDVVMSAFRSAGQRCSALRLLFVQDDVADHMIEMIEGGARELVLGDPSEPSTDVGPVIDRAQLGHACRPHRRDEGRRRRCATPARRRAAARSSRPTSSSSTGRKPSPRRSSARSCTSCAGRRRTSRRCSTPSTRPATG